MLGLSWPGIRTLAFTPEEQSKALIAVAQEAAQTEAFVIACARAYPNTTTANQRALADWKIRNGLRDFERVLAEFSKRNPEVARRLAQLRTSYVNLTLKRPSAKLEPICRDLSATLRQPNASTIKTDHANDLKIIADAARTLDRKPAATPPQNSNSSTPRVVMMSQPVAAQGFMTKPGTGLIAAQIAGMYFYQQANQRIDGFGNSYIDMTELTYEVLRDGSAYQYRCGFPPEDFDAAASQCKEPQAWGRWGGKTYKGVALKEFSPLLPARAGLRLKRGYSRTRVGMGGSIYESGIVFSSDGRFSSSSDSMITGFMQGGGVPNTGSVGGGTTVTTNAAG
ncbi:MAG: hypothetical protein HC933_05070 [Pleurocapsa sp. SU_196_0]|nr:hypothetical protein [Pleurocapsa sp. SU_196_0]